MAPTSVVQEVRSLREKGWCRWFRYCKIVFLGGTLAYIHLFRHCRMYRSATMPSVTADRQTTVSC